MIYAPLVCIQLQMSTVVVDMWHGLHYTVHTSHPPRKEKRPIIRGRREGGGGGTSKSHVVDANNGRGFLERGRSAFIHGESADRSPEFKDFNVSPAAKQWTMSRRSFSSHVLGCQERERVRRIVYFRTFEATSSVRPFSLRSLRMDSSSSFPCFHIFVGDQTRLIARRSYYWRTESCGGSAIARQGRD